MIGRFGTLIVCVLILSVLPAGAEVRQWTDENGVKHYSNKKELPDGVSAERAFEEKAGRPAPPQPRRKPLPDTRKPSGQQTIYQQRPDKPKEAVLREIRTREARLRELFERIYTKRRYVKRQGKKDIARIRRLNSEIEALAKKGTDPARMKQLKNERAAAKERLFNENLRTRKGVGADIQEYKRIEAEIAELKRSL